MPVEAVVFVVVDCSLVALMLGEFSSVFENVVGLEPIAGHCLDHFAHCLSHRFPNLHTRSHIEIFNTKTLLPYKSDVHIMLKVIHRGPKT